MSLVSISIVGHVVRPPEQMCFASGKAKTTVVVAVNTRHGKSGENKDHTDFYKVEAWGNLGDLVHNYLTKGNQVGVVGRLVLDKWTDKNGKERITPLVKAEQISLPPRFRLVEPDQDFDKVVNPVRGEIEFSTSNSEAEDLLLSEPEDSLLAPSVSSIPTVSEVSGSSRRRASAYARR